MRPLEAALHLTLILTIILLPLRAPYVVVVGLVATSVVTAIAQLALEKFRWQMTFAYVLTATCLVATVSTALTSTVAGCGLSLVWAASAFLCVAYPVFRLPEPTGNFKVGTEIRYFRSSARKDPFVEEAGVTRELIFQLWYPAEPSKLAERATYRQPASVTFRNARFSLATTASYGNAPLAATTKPVPVLLFVPSWRGQREECTALAQEFASHGYLVIGIDHPSLSARTVFPDGRIRTAVSMPGEDYSSQDALHAFVRSAELQVAVRVADVRELLDQVLRWSAPGSGDLLAARVDLTRIGIFGFSIGGSTACEACQLEPRIRAGMDLGGMVVGNCLTGEGKPFFFLFDDDPYMKPTGGNNTDPKIRRAMEFGAAQAAAMRRILRRNSGYWVRIPGTSHSDLSDAPFFSPFRFIRRGGTRDRKRVFAIIRTAALSFFGAELSGESRVTPRQLPGKYPEIDFEAYVQSDSEEVRPAPRSSGGA